MSVISAILWLILLLSIILLSVLMHPHLLAVVLIGDWLLYVIETGGVVSRARFFRRQSVVDLCHATCGVKVWLLVELLGVYWLLLVGV